MDSCVGLLELTIRAPAAARGDVRAAAEAFAVDVLERCDAMLARSAPRQVFIGRHLDLSMRLVQTALGRVEEAKAVAHAIADDVARDAVAIGTGEYSAQPDEDAIVSFESDAAWRAAHLEWRAGGRCGPAWPFAPLESAGDPLLALASDDPDTLRDVLATLDRHGSLTRALSACAPSAVDAAMRSLGGSTMSAVIVDAAVALPAAVAACIAAMSTDVPPSIGWIQLATAARAALGPSAPAADVARVATAASALRHADRVDAARDAHRRSGSSPTRDTDTHSESSRVMTRFGGAFYLLALAIELDVGQSLWHACLPEGVVLAEAIAALLGPGAADDPAPLLFGGVRSRGPQSIVSREQQREVSIATLAAFAGALPRRQLARLPDTVLDLVDTAEGRLLVACEANGPFVLFAMPAQSPNEVRAAVDLFTASWPASAPAPSAPRALAGLDRRARLRPIAHAPVDPIMVPIAAGTGSLAAAALVTQIAGSLGHLFAARAGCASPGVVAKHLTIPACVSSDIERLDVELPLERLDLDVRRAGLDADPGWIPWLNRRVAFLYIEDKLDHSACGSPA